jgi:phosphate uptake regulator
MEQRQVRNSLQLGLLAYRLVKTKSEQKMEKYLRDLSERILRISRTSLDIGTGRKLRELADEIARKADEDEAQHRNPPHESRAPYRH